MAEEAGGWERAIVEKLALAALKEQRAKRRWGILFKSLGFGIAILILLSWFGWIGEHDGPCLDECTALIDIQGEIAQDGPASAENLVSGLQEAMKHKGVKGVILRISSPGGSAVQAGIINDEIRRLRAKHPDIPVYAVVEEMAASAAYYIAVAAERIYVDKASLIGSIGVLIDGFGFTGTMEKLGVERRLLAAGANKGFLDPFSPMTEEHRAHAQKIIDEVHRQFIGAVKAGRGERLKAGPELFSGLVWSGADGVELGLADSVGSVDFVAREVIKAEDIVDFSPRRTIVARFAKWLGASFGHGLRTALAGPVGTLR